MTNWKQIDADNEARAEREYQESKKGDWASRTFHDAAYRARLWAKNDEIHGQRMADGDIRYLPSQGIKAACHGREDTAAVLVLQLPILKALQGINRLLWLCAAALVYLCYRVS